MIYSQNNLKSQKELIVELQVQLVAEIEHYNKICTIYQKKIVACIKRQVKLLLRNKSYFTKNNMKKIKDYDLSDIIKKYNYHSLVFGFILQYHEHFNIKLDVHIFCYNFYYADGTKIEF